ncbi:TonB-dependent receptor domain-containing protein [Sphingomonas sp. URHD0057]|uniref:TonB-dependent receptor domain-containing protein n=1 Tax=Sphingomonas sp. URHD0057 TaxID=1380389 RepID=UPI00048F6549|nr:TonB-dependent receptor [Sphingomonas sp. URHD0057]
MRAFNSLLLSSISIVALTASPAFAQTPAPVDTTPEKTQEGEATPPSSGPTNATGQAVAQTPPAASGGAIVVTGSRIRRNNFNTPQNIDVLTRDDQVLAGTRSVADTLQSSSVTSGTSQVSGSFLGFLSDNGTGANTVGLRGLGSSRTLVLLNGRRLSPAGVGEQLIAADLNTLPTAVVQRIEILREGASSIYGSDAIAGVINVVTDTSINGITLDGFADNPLIGAGQTLRGSITAGKTFARGHIMASFEYKQDQGLDFGDRKDTRCARELAFVNGHEVGQTRPHEPGTLRCYSLGPGPTLGTPAGYGLGSWWRQNLTGPAPGPARVSFADYWTGHPDIFGVPVAVAKNQFDFNDRPDTNYNILDNTFLTPLKTYTGYVNGSYELGALGDAELYGEGLFVRRTSHQYSTDRLDWLGSASGGSALTVQRYGPDFFPGDQYYVHSPIYASQVSPFYPIAWNNAGLIATNPLYAPNFVPQNKQKVDFWRANGGIRGNLGLGDWRYDANVQLSHTKGRDDRQVSTTDAVTNVLNAVVAPSGTPADFITTALPGQYLAGQSFTCASNVTNGAYNGGTCQPLNIFDPNVFLNGAITPQQIAYLYPWLNYTKTTYKQETFALNFDGTLFALPGGDVKSAVGFEYRGDHIDDQPGAERSAGDIYRYGTAARTKGSDNVKEAYAEIDLPFFRDRPFLNLLELDASGRYTDYKSYGTGWTYHLGAQWAPVAAVRFRGNYGTNFRAPNLYEQFVASQIGFQPNSLDPCDLFPQKSAPGQALYDHCLSELTAAFNGNQAKALNYGGQGGGFQVETTGGAGVVKAETARTWGGGVVLTVPKRIADFSLAVDLWNINVKGEVSVLGAQNILLFCLDTDTYGGSYPDNPYCALAGARYTVANAPTPNAVGNLVLLKNPYLNIASQKARGIDFDARYAARFFGGQFSTQLQATRMLKQSIVNFPGGQVNDFNGTLGYPGAGAGPKWSGSLDTRFKTGGFTFRWGVNFIGKMSSQQFATAAYRQDDGTVCPLGAGPGCFLVDYDFKVPNYFEHSVSAQYLWRDIGEFTIGVNNLFDKDPPTISNDNVNPYGRFGNFFANSGYDYRGRSIFVNVTRTFK